MKNKVVQILKENSINNVGFCDFDVVKAQLLDYRAKLRLPQNPQTVIMCAFPYKAKNEPPKMLSRYAALPDYHNICGDMLKTASIALKKEYPQNKFEYFCDNSPIPEVLAAATAGLGVKGDNGLLITQKYGSYVFLGEIVTDLHIESESKYSECEHCGKCKTACPVTLDKQNCLSNLSQQKKLTDCELETLQKNNILWGCDICAAACPHNKTAQNTDIAQFINGYRDAYLPDEDPTDRPYTWRGTEPIKRNYKNLVCK
ncbi:MAG: DUF1730 domain-containing protein [Clostridia bacterium]|nr:DUF1730 domain-containing protein [Clostridia bacterium]